MSSSRNGSRQDQVSPPPSAPSDAPNASRSADANTKTEQVGAETGGMAAQEGFQADVSGALAAMADEDVMPGRQAILDAAAEIEAAGIIKTLPDGIHLNMPDLEVTATARRRRAGRAFGPQPTVIPRAELTEELLAELDGDSFLKLRAVSPSGL